MAKKEELNTQQNQTEEKRNGIFSKQKKADETQIQPEEIAEKPEVEEAPHDKPSNQEQNIRVVKNITQKREIIRKKRFMTHLSERVSKKQFSFWRQGFGGLIDEYQSYKNIKEEAISKYIAYETVVDGATDTLEYYVLIILSCLIATIGLYQNSPAVIIGAMIVAPLMGPIFGLSAGVLWGDTDVIWEALTTLFKGSLIVIAISAVMTYLIPGIQLTEEMLARTQPGFFDSIVALSCGFIGAYAFVNKKVSTTVPGVAISVALMPPLCTAGISLGMGQWQMAEGSALLFLVNLLGISLSSLITFYLVRLNPHGDEDEEEGQKMRYRAVGSALLSVSLFLLISVPMLYLTKSGYEQNQLENEVYGLVEEAFPESKIFSLDLIQGETNSVDIVFLHSGGDESNRNLLSGGLSGLFEEDVLLNIYVISELSEPKAASQIPAEEL